MEVTFEVLKLDKSREVRETQSLKIYSITGIDEVLKLEIFKYFKDLHPLNI
jgi:hypothetical protein